MTQLPCNGIFEGDPRGFGFVRAVTLDLRRSPEDCYVSPELVTRFRLRPGVLIEGSAQARMGKSPQVTALERVNGLAPAAWARVKEFHEHEVVSPDEWIRLEGKANDRAMRVIDLFSPIGRGQRGLIVSPPKAGKTILIQQMAHAISANYPEIDVIVLLIDERPEEVTDIRRRVRGQVFASSSDTERGLQTRLAQLALELAKRKVEAGRDVVLLLDSLTRLGRAFNISQKGTGRTMSGGVDIRALEIPKRIFGAARKLEGHGSLTILASALVETNSRMDELIFEEFKGTGNMELVLDRSLANERIFPAINLLTSGTRREELLFDSMLREHQELRRSIARLSAKNAMTTVLRLLEQYPDNATLLSRVRQ
jgi:transcription termination factor Rho